LKEGKKQNPKRRGPFPVENKKKNKPPYPIDGKNDNRFFKKGKLLKMPREKTRSPLPIPREKRSLGGAH